MFSKEGDPFITTSIEEYGHEEETPLALLIHAESESVVSLPMACTES